MFTTKYRCKALSSLKITKAKGPKSVLIAAGTAGSPYPTSYWVMLVELGGRLAQCIVESSSVCTPLIFG